MSGALIEMLVRAAEGNIALAFVLVALFAANGMQSYHFDQRIGSVNDHVDSVEERVKRTETFLMDRARADGGEVEEVETDD